ncbi:MAG: translation elongation factor-like protein [Candidatus Sungbacteria bacterium]|nr:translation elongation factor-like protein [Candidatus Sungbacteria bacterium]
MEEQIGKIIHYYDKIGVAVVRLEGGLKAGDTVHVKGKVSDFEQTVESMQLDHKDVSSAKKGEEVAVKLSGKAKEGDIVYKK